MIKRVQDNIYGTTKYIKVRFKEDNFISFDYDIKRKHGLKAVHHQFGFECLVACFIYFIACENFRLDYLIMN